MIRSAATNAEVGLLIGLDHTSISRLRSGTRRPSLTVMSAMSDHFDWSLDDQALALRNGCYHVEFEKILIHKYGKSSDVVPTGA